MGSTKRKVRWRQGQGASYRRDAGQTPTRSRQTAGSEPPIRIRRRGLIAKASNVFVSHKRPDERYITSLRILLGNGGFTLRNFSIDSSKFNNATSEHYIKYEILKPRIKRAGALAVLLGSETSKSKWVHWEIECAYRLGKPIIGIKLPGCDNPELPEAFSKYGGTPVAWSKRAIIEAICGKQEEPRMEPDGSLSNPLWTPVHHTC